MDKNCPCIGGVSPTSISITSLDSDSSSSISVLSNDSNSQINNEANLRDYLMSFTQNLIIGNADSIEIQASSLAQLTQATNQLTRKSAVRKTHPPFDLICISNSYWHRKNVIN